MRKGLFVFFLFVIISVTVLVGVVRNREKQIIEKINNYAIKSGAKIVIDGKKVDVVRDEVVYHYKIKYGQLRFEKLETVIPINLENHGDSAQLFITSQHNDVYEVRIKVDYIEEKPNGQCITVHESFGFSCNDDFTAESLSKTDGNAILGKSERYYNIITHNYISGEDLKKLLMKAYEIRDELTG